MIKIVYRSLKGYNRHSSVSSYTTLGMNSTFSAMLNTSCTIIQNTRKRFATISKVAHVSLLRILLSISNANTYLTANLFSLRIGCFTCIDTMTSFFWYNLHDELLQRISGQPYQSQILIYG